MESRTARAGGSVIKRYRCAMNKLFGFGVLLASSISFGQALDRSNSLTR